VNFGAQTLWLVLHEYELAHILDCEPMLDEPGLEVLGKQPLQQILISLVYAAFT
jgi:hypothetical protein